MICEACKRGADYLTSLSRDPRNKVYPGDVTVAEGYHHLCKGCDCQHRVELQVEGRSVR